MGCVPACDGNGNSYNVSYSQPSLHFQGSPLGRGTSYVNGRVIKKVSSCHSDALINKALKRSDKI